MENKKCQGSNGTENGIQNGHSEIWFPTKITDLDETSGSVYLAGVDLDSDHPGFNDPVYRKRRNFFSEISFNYRQGDPIPYVEYTEEENETWSTVYRELMKMVPKYACKQYMQNLPLLDKYCNFDKGKVPQLKDVSKFLSETTGFSLRPVAGYLSSRDFLAALAFRVFCCTQYIRHPSKPFYTPEPDICHEMLGHVPLFANEEFADFSQEIGMASLGASDEDLESLAKVYFFTVEFGICHQNGERKAYGAGLLSSISELLLAMETREKQRDFRVKDVLRSQMHVTTFQDAYFVTESFRTAKQELRSFAASIKRDFCLKYNPYTRSISILRTREHFEHALVKLNQEIDELEQNWEQISSIS